MGNAPSQDKEDVVPAREETAGRSQRRHSEGPAGIDEADGKAGVERLGKVGVKPAKKESKKRQRSRDISTAARVGSRNKRVRISLPEDDVVVETNAEDERNAAPTRRGRSSINSEELNATFEQAIYPQHKGKKQQATDTSPGANESSASLDVLDDAATSARRRGRSSHTKAEVQAISTEATKAQHKGHKKDKKADREPTSSSPSAPRPGRNPNNNLSKIAEEATPSSMPRRGRSSQTEAEVRAIYKEAIWGQKNAHVDALDSVPPSSSSQKGPKQSKSTSRPNTSVNNATTSSSQEAANQKARGRRSGTVIEVETATSSFSRSKPKKSQEPATTATSTRNPASKLAKGQSKSKNSLQASKSNTSETSQPERTQKKVERPLKDAVNPRQRTEVHGEKHRRAEKPSVPEEEEDISEHEDLLVYQRLVAVTRRISRQTINSKWEPLPPGCVERIAQLLQDTQRPVVQHLNSERKRTQASTALQMVSRKLVSKISKGLPFPKETHHHQEDDFDFEKILDHTRRLESILTPTLHANMLLESNLATETALLEQEKKNLKWLETNAKTEATLRRDAARKLHTLLRPDSSMANDELDPATLRVNDGSTPSALDVCISTPVHRPI